LGENFCCCFVGCHRQEWESPGFFSPSAGSGPSGPPNKVDASRRAEKCRSLRVQVEVGVSGCALRPILLSAPYSLPPQPCFRPIVPSAPCSLSPHIPYRLSLASTPHSLPPQAPFRPRLASAPASRPPQPPFRPSLPCACVRVLGVSEFSPAEAKCGGAVRVSWLTSMRGACAALRRLTDSSVAELPGGTSLRWSTPAQQRTTYSRSSS
jgi:hypothetical protein